MRSVLGLGLDVVDWNASWEASRATLLRCYGVGEFVCWVALLCLSLLLFGSINLYDLVELVLQGPIGVAIGLVLLVTYDYCYEWTRWDLLGPLIVVVTGVISHALRLCEEDNPLLSMAPQSVRRRAEALCLERLRYKDGIEVLHDFQAAEEDAPATEVFLGNSYGAEQPPDHPIDLSGAPETMARLRRQHLPSVRRGRQTPSRGVCPVPGNVGVVPGAGGQAFVQRNLGEGQRATTAGRWLPLTPQAPTHFAHETGEVMV
ncbi:hypothetical protein PInf_008228 [Phytophthora infestans]|nr:hypothetical protein PInf_008225 [Phytophthora infestans]KAI9982313.1 hypothetical protein PInf_008228 [Phytophthora infestans]